MGHLLEQKEKKGGGKASWRGPQVRGNDVICTFTLLRHECAVRFKVLDTKSTDDGK
jgi:hypothetical protein